MSPTKSWEVPGGPGSWPYRLFDAWRNRLNRRLVRYLTSVAVRRTGSVILEAGSGPGYASSLMASQRTVRLAVALDIDGEALREARRRDPALPVVQADLHHLPFRSEAFDLAWNSSTIEHVESPADALGEMRRVVRAGGHVFVGVPYRWGLLWFQPWIEGTRLGAWIGRVFDRPQLVRMVREQGLTPIATTTYFFSVFLGVLAGGRTSPGLSELHRGESDQRGAARASRIGVMGTVLVVALVAAGGVVALTTDYFSAPQRLEYSDIAENMLRGRGPIYEYLGATYSFYGPPLYPIVLAGVLWASNGGEAAALVLQLFLFALSCVFVYAIAEKLYGNPGARLAAFLAALHPGNLVYAGKLHPQILDVFLLTLSFLLLARGTGAAAFLANVGSGVVIGLAVVSRGTVVTFAALWAAWFLWRERAHGLRAARVMMGLTVGGTLVIAPIVARGYLQYGELMPLRTDVGVNLWYGNHPGASGTSYTLSPSPVPVISQIPPELSARISGASEIDQNRIFTAAAMEFVRNHPGSAFVLFVKKLYYFWWFSPHTGLFYPAAWLITYRVYYGVVLLFALVGLVVSLRSPRPHVRAGAILFLLMAGALSVTQALFYVEGRHRWQVEPLLLIFTAVGALRLLSYLRPVPARSEQRPGLVGQ